MFQPEYAVLVGLALLTAFLFPLTRHMKARADRRQYWKIQIITMVGALIGAKLSVAIGDAGWPLRPVDDWSVLLWSGRSITGALLLGFLAAEAAKPLMKYEMPPNDRFATMLPFSFAIGRIGCLLAGCCLGAKWDGFCSIADAAGVRRHPAVVYEMLFQLAVGGLFVWMLHRRMLHGRFFSLYLMLYGTFRFGVEFIRDTPRYFGPLSGYQVICLLMIPTGAAFFIKRSLTQPSSWRKFETVTGNPEPV
jgi:phosphatidylglycerol:prolipoprotein diacylglycerol transferase